MLYHKSLVRPSSRSLTSLSLRWWLLYIHPPQIFMPPHNRRQVPTTQYCANNNGTLNFKYDSGWNSSPDSGHQCKAAFCTQQGGSKLAISQIPGPPGQKFGLTGYWPDNSILFPTTPPNASQAFAAQVDGVPVDLEHNAVIKLDENGFTIVGTLGNRDGTHVFQFTNLQNHTPVCIYDAEFDLPANPFSTQPATTVTAQVGPNPSTATTAGRSSEGHTKTKLIAIGATVTVVGLLLALSVTFWLIRRRKKWRVSQSSLIPQPLTDIKLDGEEQPPRYSVIQHMTYPHRETASQNLWISIKLDSCLTGFTFQRPCSLRASTRPKDPLFHAPIRTVFNE